MPSLVREIIRDSVELSVQRSHLHRRQRPFQLEVCQPASPTHPPRGQPSRPSLGGGADEFMLSRHGPAAAAAAAAGTGWYGMALLTALQVEDEVIQCAGTRHGQVRGRGGASRARQTGTAGRTVTAGRPRAGARAAAPPQQRIHSTVLYIDITPSRALLSWSNANVPRIMSM